MKTNHNPLSILFLAVISILGLSSCGDIQQDVYLNTNGSGKLVASFELGEMLAMTKGLGDLNISDITLSENMTADSIAMTNAEEKDPMQALMDKITDPTYDKAFDSVFHLLDLMPDSVRKNVTREDLVKKMAMRLTSPANSGDLTIGMEINFDNIGQLKDIINHLDTMDGSAMVMPDGSGGGFPKESFMLFEVNMKEGWIRYDTTDFTGLSAELGLGGQEMMSSEELGMMEMMFGNSKIKSVVHVPGEVLSCTNKDAILTKDNKVIVEHEFIDIMKTGKVPGFTIQFKPK